MAEQLGILTLLPPVIAIILAILTRQVFISLLVGIFLGYVILAGGDPWIGFLDTMQGLVNVFADADNTRTIMFCALVGALIVFMQRSGGVAGFIVAIDERLRVYEQRKDGSSRTVVQLLAWITGVLIFVESSISVLTVGTLYRPIFDKLGLSREKLAYIADSILRPELHSHPLQWLGGLYYDPAGRSGLRQPLRHYAAGNGLQLLCLCRDSTGARSNTEWPGVGAYAERRATGAPGTGPQRRSYSGSRRGVDQYRSEGRDRAPGGQYGRSHRGDGRLHATSCWPTTGWAAASEALAGSAGTNDQASVGEMLFLAIGKWQRHDGRAGRGDPCPFSCQWLFYKVQGIFGMRESVDLVLKGIAGLIPLALLDAACLCHRGAVPAVGNGHLRLRSSAGLALPGARALSGVCSHLLHRLQYGHELGHLRHHDPHCRTHGPRYGC